MESLHGWHNNLRFDLLHKGLIGKRNRRNSSHTPCVEPCVSFSDAFVILGQGEDFIGLTISEHKTRQLNSIQKLFNYHLLTGFSKLRICKHGDEFRFGLSKLVENHHALTSCQAIGFKYIGWCYSFKIGKTFRKGVFGKTFINSSGNVMALHKGLGKLFTAFEFCALLARSNQRDMCQLLIRSKKINHPFH